MNARRGYGYGYGNAAHPAQGVGAAVSQNLQQVPSAVVDRVREAVGGVQRTFNAERTLPAGGQFLSEIMHPTITPFERLYRRLPEEGMYDAGLSASSPFTFELGAFTVPASMALMIFDFRADVYRFSGINAGDFVPLEERRLSSVMGYKLSVDQQPRGNISFELDPVPITESQLAFASNNTVHPSFNAGQFSVSSANNFGIGAGAGTALFPQRPTRYGAPNIPFTIYARSNQTVQFQGVIFRRLPMPIAFVEMDVTGVLVPEDWMNTMLEAVKPPNRKGEDSIR